MGYGSGYGKKGLGRYQDKKVQTASPAQIMIMLYDGAIRFSPPSKEKNLKRKILRVKVSSLVRPKPSLMSL